MPNLFPAFDPTVGELKLIEKAWEADPPGARSAHGKCASFR
jgi:hypothetical protein